MTEFFVKIMSKVIILSKEVSGQTEFKNAYGHLFKKVDEYKESDDLIQEADAKDAEEDGEMLSDTEAQDTASKVLPSANKEADNLKSSQPFKQWLVRCRAQTGILEILESLIDLCDQNSSDAGDQNDD